MLQGIIIYFSIGTRKLDRTDGKIHQAEYQAKPKENVLETTNDFFTGVDLYLPEEHDSRNIARATEWFSSKPTVVEQVRQSPYSN